MRGLGLQVEGRGRGRVTFSPESSVILIETIDVFGWVPGASAANVLIDLSMTATLTATDPPVFRPAQVRIGGGVRVGVGSKG